MCLPGYTSQYAAYGLDLTYLVQLGLLKPSVTAWHVTSFQTALLGTADHLITGYGAPTDELQKLRVVPPSGRCSPHRDGTPTTALDASKHHHLKENIYSNIFLFTAWMFLLFVCEYTKSEGWQSVLVSWHGLVSEFLHVPEPQELGESVTRFKSNNKHHPLVVSRFFSPTSELSRYTGLIRPDTCTTGIWRPLENKCFFFFCKIFMDLLKRGHFSCSWSQDVEKKHRQVT